MFFLFGFIRNIFHSELFLSRFLQNATDTHGACSCSRASKQITEQTCDQLYLYCRISRSDVNMNRNRSIFSINAFVGGTNISPFLIRSQHGKKSSVCKTQDMSKMIHDSSKCLLLMLSLGVCIGFAGRQVIPIRISNRINKFFQLVLWNNLFFRKFVKSIVLLTKAIFYYSTFKMSFFQTFHKFFLCVDFRPSKNFYTCRRNSTPKTELCPKKKYAILYSR